MITTTADAPSAPTTKKPHWSTVAKAAREAAKASQPAGATVASPEAPKPVKPKAKAAPAPKAALAPVFTEEDTPEHTVTEVAADKKVIFGQTHWIIFKTPNGGTQKFAHKGKPSKADIIAIHKAMMVKITRDAELKAEADERHREAMKRMTER